MNLSTTLLVALSSIGLFSASGFTAEALKPNIIVVLCDDLGYGDVGFYGAEDIRTPQLDLLAESGTVFTSAYVCHPFCGPSRMGMMSGRYPHTIDAPFNLPNAGHGIEEYNRQGIDVNEVLMSSMLQGAGYYTGAIGKWHMGIDPQFHPNNRGFDDYYGFLGGGHSYFPERFNAIYERQVKSGQTLINDYLLPLERNGVEVDETEYITDGLSREAERFVTEASATGKPFFLYLAYNAPHSPLEAKEEDMAEFAGIEDVDRRTYAGMVYAVDRGVGRLVQALKKNGEYDDTLIVFLSDNGGKLSLGATNGRLREGKGSVYEGGHRVPMFFHWPRNVAPNNRYEHPVSSLDLYPTFAELAGAQISSEKTLDGRSIWASFSVDESVRGTDPLYILRHRTGYSDVGARFGKWKIVRVSQSSWKLFDIEADSAENNDLSSKYPELLQNMIKEVEKWSRTHTQPKWFSAAEEGENWARDKMPHFDKTFEVD